MGTRGRKTKADKKKTGIAGMKVVGKAKPEVVKSDEEETDGRTMVVNEADGADGRTLVGNEVDDKPAGCARKLLRTGPAAFRSLEEAMANEPSKLSGKGVKKLQLFEVTDTDGIILWTWGWTHTEAASRAAQFSGWSVKRCNGGIARRSTIERLMHDAVRILTTDQRRDLIAKLAGVSDQPSETATAGPMNTVELRQS